MTLTEISQRFGTARLWVFALLVLLFCLLNLARAPFLLIGYLLTAAMNVIDRVVITRVSSPTDQSCPPSYAASAA